MIDNFAPCDAQEKSRASLSGSAHDDPRFCSAIESYLHACENGPAPDVEAFVQQYPEFQWRRQRRRAAVAA